MKKFEYLITTNSTEEELNKLGSIGWELISCNLKHLRSRFRKLELIKIDTIYTFKKETN